MTVVELRLRMVLFAVMAVVSAAYTAEAFDFHLLARYTPLVAGSMSTCLFAALTVREFVRLRRARDAGDDVQLEFGRTIEAQDVRAVTVASLRSGAIYVGAIVAFVVMIWVVGLRVAAPLFVLAFMIVDHRTSSRIAILSSVGTIIAIYLLSFVGLQWPEGALTHF